jgi:hypothetical protein
MKPSSGENLSEPHSAERRREGRGGTPNSAWSLPGLWFTYMSTETLLIIVVLVLLLGGGGFFWSRRGR